MPRTRFWTLFALLVASALWAGEPAPPKPIPLAEMEKLVKHIGGHFDLSANMRPFQVVLILDQAGNPYPSFWCGRNEKGRISFLASVDPLDHNLEITQTGEMTLLISHTARKTGMYNQLPAGAWITKALSLDKKQRSDGYMRISFTSFTEPKLGHIGQGSLWSDVSEATSKSGKMIPFAMKCGGLVNLADRSAPFQGTATVTFLDSLPVFSLAATFPFPGSELGLEGDAGKGITATLYTASAPQTKQSAPKGQDAVDEPGSLDVPDSAEARPEPKKSRKK